MVVVVVVVVVMGGGGLLTEKILIFQKFPTLNIFWL